MTRHLIVSLMIATLTLCAAACSDENGGDNGDDGNNVANNTVNNAGNNDVNNDDNNDTPDANDDPEDIGEGDGGGMEDITEDEPEPDIVDEPDMMDEPDVIDPNCDQDRDNSLSQACGGNDCDDNDPQRSPLQAERCDDLDNDCNAIVNDGVACSFYAHTGDNLYLLDPFAKTIQEVAEVPNLFDIDTHPDGTLYGITATELYRFDEALARWFLVGNFPQIEGGTGLAIDSFGTAFVTAEDQVYTVDLNNAQTQLVGALGGDFFSSGDCVVNKQDTLFMTSKAFDEPDTLVVIDRATGRGTAIGQIVNPNDREQRFTNVFGLTAGWGKLFGLNSRGELIEIDRATGAGTLVHTFEDVRWFGAASNPER